MERVIITLTKGARTSTLETQGFTGEACKLATEVFKRHLGTVQAEENTPEFFAAVHCEQQAQQG
jgi:hypothetical protein